MFDGLLAGDDAMDGFAGFEIDDIEADGFAEANIGVAILAVDGVWEDTEFANVFDLEGDLFVTRVEHGQHSVGAEKNAAAVEGDDAVVGLRADGDAAEEISVFGVHDEEAAV